MQSNKRFIINLSTSPDVFFKWLTILLQRGSMIVLIKIRTTYFLSRLMFKYLKNKKKECVVFQNCIEKHLLL